MMLHQLASSKLSYFAQTYILPTGQNENTRQNHFTLAVGERWFPTLYIDARLCSNIYSIEQKDMQQNIPFAFFSVHNVHNNDLCYYLSK